MRSYRVAKFNSLLIEQSRFRFTGEAKIDKEWSAGYILEIGLQGHPSNQWNQLSPNSSNANPANGDNSLLVRKSNWFIKARPTDRSPWARTARPPTTFSTMPTCC